MRLAHSLCTTVGRTSNQPQSGCHTVLPVTHSLTAPSVQHVFLLACGEQVSRQEALPGNPGLLGTSYRKRNQEGRLQHDQYLL